MTDTRSILKGSEPARHRSVKQKPPSATNALLNGSSVNTSSVNALSSVPPTLAPPAYPFNVVQEEGSRSLGNLSAVLDFLHLARERLREQQRQLQCALHHHNLPIAPCAADSEGSSIDYDALHRSPSIPELASPPSLFHFTPLAASEEEEGSALVTPSSLMSSGPSKTRSRTKEARGVSWIPGLLLHDNVDEYQEDDAVGSMSHATELEQAWALNRMLSIDEPTSSSGGGVSSETEVPNEEELSKVGAPKSLIEAQVLIPVDADVECQPEVEEYQLQASLPTLEEQGQSTPVGDGGEAVLKKKRPWWTQKTLKQMKRLFFTELEHDGSVSPSPPVKGVNAVPLGPSSVAGETPFIEHPSLEEAPGDGCAQPQVRPEDPSPNTKTTKHANDQALKTSGTPRQDVLMSEERQHAIKGGRSILPAKDKSLQQPHQHGRHGRKAYIFVDNSNILVGFYNYYRLHYPETDDKEEDENEMVASERIVDKGGAQEALIGQASQQSPAKGTSEVSSPHQLIQQLSSPTTLKSLGMHDDDATEALSSDKYTAKLSRAGTRSKKTVADGEKEKAKIPTSENTEVATKESTGSSIGASHGIQMAFGSENLPKFRYPLFFQLLERGRSTVKKELVGSSPLHQKLDVAMDYGYEVRILKRVRKLLEGQLGAVPVPVKKPRYPPGQYANNNTNSNNTIASTSPNKSSKFPIVPTRQEKRSNNKIATASCTATSTSKGQAPLVAMTAMMSTQLTTSGPSQEIVVVTKESDPFQSTSPTLDVAVHAGPPTTPASTLATLDSTVVTHVWSEIGVTIGHTTTSPWIKQESMDGPRVVDTMAIASDVTHYDIGINHKSRLEREIASLAVTPLNTPAIPTIPPAITKTAIAATEASTTATISTTTTTAAEIVAVASANAGLPQGLLVIDEPLLQDLHDLPLECSNGASSNTSATVELGAGASDVADGQVLEKKEKEEDVKSKKVAKESRSKISKDILSSIVTIRGEQCVDELLHLKILETLLDCEPGVIVLATGDGAPSEYGGGGFYDVVKRALDRGWLVEIFSWEDQLSGCYLELVQEYGWHALSSWPAEAGDREATEDVGESQQLHYQQHQNRHHYSHHHHPQQQQHVMEGSTDVNRRDYHRPNPHHYRHHMQDTRLPRGQHQSFKRRGTIRVVCLDWLGEKFL
ncbi:hypothetical protein DFQ27_009927 [Actinomortierella ambigua]|uniref:NYN domain-containing protein n=1 Tax=Actinomortierella ambigua TaxID=1343610 RepID=A0A9P6QGN4_9FUNG|nr:hypothetical protein DFQ27_009927 [Actinomortierella ambigua]